MSEHEAAQGKDVAEIRAKIADIDRVLSSGRFPRDALLDLNSAVNDLRNRMWALVNAVGAEDPAQVLARLRARRGAEMLGATCHDLSAGHIAATRHEMRALTAACQDLLAITG